MYYTTMNELLLMTLPAAITSVITYLLTRKKNLADVNKINAEVEANEIDNVERVAKIWRQLSEDLKEKLSSEIEVLREENTNMKSELTTVQQQFTQVISENSELKMQMNSLEKELKSSKCQIKQLSDQNKSLLTELTKFNKNYSEAS